MTESIGACELQHGGAPLEALVVCPRSLRFALVTVSMTGREHNTQRVPLPGQPTLNVVARISALMKPAKIAAYTAVGRKALRIKGLNGNHAT